jgi:hypothetical protein
MVSESICLDILRFGRGTTLVVTKKIGNIPPEESTHSDAFGDADIYRHLLPRYPMAEIEAALRWLRYSNYIANASASIRGPNWIELTKKGRDAADAKQILEEDRRLLYQDQNLHQVFIAHQFNTEDSSLVKYIRERVLAPAGFEVVDGRADGLEEFRTAIIGKIKRARFFLCLLTERIQLTNGGFASSVWLYQETGVAVAFGKRPLLLVERSIDREYVGELQSTYEHISFSRSDHPQAFDKIVPRLTADLNAHSLPLPQANS